MAYRSLPRPSSPRGAKASIVRPYTLGKKLLASRYVAILFDSRLAFQGSKNGAGVVGLTGVEPVTSSLSGTRSNQLSYTPGRGASHSFLQVNPVPVPTYLKYIGGA